MKKKLIFCNDAQACWWHYHTIFSVGGIAPLSYAYVSECICACVVTLCPSSSGLFLHQFVPQLDHCGDVHLVNIYTLQLI